MALTTSNVALRQQVINAKMFKQSLLKSMFWKKGFQGSTSDDNSVILFEDNPNVQFNGSKASVTFSLRARVTGDPIIGSAEAVGNGTVMDMYTQTVSLDQMRKPIELASRIDAVRSAFELDMEAMEAASDYIAEQIEYQTLMKLGGVTETDLTDASGTVYSGSATFSNTAAAVPTDDQTDGLGTRYYRAGRTGTGDGLDDLAAADVITLADIYRLDAMGKSVFPKLKPINMGGKKMFMLVMHPRVVHDLQTQNSGVNWSQINREAGPRNDSNDIRTDALGVINNTILLSHDGVPTAQASANFDASGPAAGVRAYRNLFLGAGALAFITGRTRGLKTPTFMEKEYRDANDKLTVVAGFVGGMQKLTFINSVDNGVIAYDTASSLD